MSRSFRARALHLVPAALIAAGACDQPDTPATAPIAARAELASNVGSNAFPSFTPIAAPFSCTVSGGDPINPFLLPTGFRQERISDETKFLLDVPDMNTLNETGPNAGRYLYRTHEVGSNGAVSVTDMVTGATSIVVQRADWESLDGIRWTPWGTILFAEEKGTGAIPDPQVPQAQQGLVYELDPNTKQVTVRPALGSKAHEGMIFDSHGNLYGISERTGGAIFRFVPTTPGDLSSGKLYALKVTSGAADNTGAATWVLLDQAAATVNADVEATAKGASGFNRPEDLDYRNGAVFAAITSDHRVIRIDLEGFSATRAFVSNYVKAGVNAPSDFQWPDNLTFDAAGNLFITEDPGGSFPSKTRGDGIWMATPGATAWGQASQTLRFASLTDCDAEPTGLYFDNKRNGLFVNVQHRGGDKVDLAVLIRR